MTKEQLHRILNDTSVNQHIVIMKTVEFLKQRGTLRVSR